MEDSEKRATERKTSSNAMLESIRADGNANQGYSRYKSFMLRTNKRK